MMYILVIFSCLAIIGIIIALIEAKKSPLIDSKLPFLRGDYDPEKDPTLKHQKVFCENCAFFDGTNICLESPMSEVNDNRVNHCKINNMFMPK